MKLGAFSISLNVKDLNVSKEFYENLGFTAFGGDIKMNYLIMKNGNALIGLFQGMFEKFGNSELARLAKREFYLFRSLIFHKYKTSK